VDWTIPMDSPSSSVNFTTIISKANGRYPTRADSEKRGSLVR